MYRSLASSETTPGTAAVIDLLTAIQDIDFDAQIFHILLMSISVLSKIFQTVL